MSHRRIPGLAGLALAFVLLLALPGGAYAQWSSAFRSPGGAEQFRLGVEAFQRGRFPEAILLFEKCLAYEGRQDLVSYWLGRAYLKSGYEATALRVWEGLAADPAAPPFLRARVEAMEASKDITVGGLVTEYIEEARFEGKRGSTVYFSRPAALLPLPDGSVYVAAQGTNDLLRIDPNGVIQDKRSGGLQGFDRPFGLAQGPDGSLFVTEFNGDRITRLLPGKPLTFGTKGRGLGQVLGPQYAACDEAGYLYVNDYGNARVVKFDPEGKAVLEFGRKTEAFPGFVSPTGIAVVQGLVYVADSFRKALYEFDTDGNFVGILGEGFLHAPEGLSPWRLGGSLLVADTDRVVDFDLATETATVLYQAPGSASRLVAAVQGANGNLLASDFDASAVLVLTPPSLLATGLGVDIERVGASGFPTVEVDVRVRDALGRPLVGLEAANFHLSERVRTSTVITENGKKATKTVEVMAPAANVELLSNATGPTPVRAALLIDGTAEFLGYRDSFRSLLAELYKGFPESSPASFSWFTMGAVPAQAAKLGAGYQEISKAAIAKPQSGSRLDLGLRLAASSLLPSGPRDAVVYIGTGQVTSQSFGATTLSELAAFLQNNGIRFYAIILGQTGAAPALSYLAEETGGMVYAASRTAGLGDLAAHLASSRSGAYRLRFTSKANSDFGEAYLGLSVEAYLYKTSGRDESGYFGPRH